jgi:hypothetical protein
MSLASPRRDGETPEGVTPNEEDAACETKPMAGPVEDKAAPAAEPTADCAKQTQSPAVAPVRKTPAPLRARPRVAYHYHTGVRPY